jgi:hypothetical protein
MSIQDGSPQSPDFDFDAIQAAVRETERGRWFLSEYDRRNRSADTQSLLEAIGKLNKIVRSAPLEHTDRVSRPGTIEAIRKAKAEIEAAQICPPPGATLFSQGNPFGSLKVEARSLAVEVSQLCEVMQQTLEQQQDDPEGMVGAMAHVSQRLSDISTLQSHFAARMARAVDLLVYLDQEMEGDGDRPADIATRLEKLLDDEVPRATPALSEDNLKFFCKDEELFAAKAEKPFEPSPIAPLHSSAAAAAAPISSEPSPTSTEAGAKARIVIVRTPSSAAQPIPLADSSLDPAAPPAA